MLPTLSYAAWKEQGFPGPPVAATMLSSRPGHWATWGIRFFEALKHRRSTHWNHATHYAGGGMVWSQNATKVLESLSSYIGQDLRFWWDDTYTADMRRRIIEEEELREGTVYDPVGIVGQILRPIPLIGNTLANAFQVSAANFCSESVIEVERTVNPAYCGEGSAQQSPEDINTWCSATNLKRYTVRLVD